MVDMEQQQTPTAAQQELQQLIAENKKTFDRHIKDTKKLVKQLAKTLNDELSGKVIALDECGAITITKVESVGVCSYNYEAFCVKGSYVNIEKDGVYTIVDDDKYRSTFSFKEISTLRIIENTSDVFDLIKCNTEAESKAKKLFEKLNQK